MPRWQEGDPAQGARVRAAREQRRLTREQVEDVVRRVYPVKAGWQARVEAGRQVLWDSPSTRALRELLPEAFD